MQEQNIVQINPQVQVQKPLFQFSPDLRLGYIVFNINKKIFKKNSQQALKYLSKFYTKQYVQRSAQKILSLNNEYFAVEQIEHFKKDPLNHFPLQSIFDYHIHFVSRTSQQIFTLKKADFKLMSKSPIKNLRQEFFWSVSFVQLKCMNLSDCQLLNIQGLTYCNLPVLQKLQIQDNHITSISSLAKCGFKHLKQFSLFNNPLNDIKKIIRLQSPNIEKIQIDEENRQTPFQVRRFARRINLLNQVHPYTEAIDFMLKLQCRQNVKQIQVEFRCRMEPKWHQEIMKKINPQLKIHTKFQLQRRRQIRNHQNDMIDEQMFFDIIRPWNNAFYNQQGQNLERRQRIQQIRRIRNQQRIAVQAVRRRRRIQRYLQQ